MALIRVSVVAMAAPFVRLVSWNSAAAEERAGLLRAAGYRVDACPFNPSCIITQFRVKPPAAIVIDLDRLPSHGHALAAHLRQSKATRCIPIVFVGGLPEKVERVRAELPDATYADWKQAAGAVKRALKNPPAHPVTPVAHMQRFAGSSLTRKLGLKPAMRVALLGAPENIEEMLGDLPEGLELQREMSCRSGLVFWFVRSLRELADVDYMAARLPQGVSIWIAHPKSTSRYKTDFNQNDVRAAGLAAGLVDYKVCAVDADWSALKFTRKK